MKLDVWLQNIELDVWLQNVELDVWQQNVELNVWLLKGESDVYSGNFNLMFGHRKINTVFCLVENT